MAIQSKVSLQSILEDIDQTGGRVKDTENYTTSLSHQLERIGLIDGEACGCGGCEYVAIWVKPGIEDLYRVR